jgi:hypothetical protein
METETFSTKLPLLSRDKEGLCCNRSRLNKNIIGFWRDRREAVFSFVPMLQRVRLLVAHRVISRQRSKRSLLGGKATVREELLIAPNLCARARYSDTGSISVGSSSGAREVEFCVHRFDN